MIKKKNIEPRLIRPNSEFAVEFESRTIHGEDVLSDSRVAIVGLARNCQGHLWMNYTRLMESIASKSKDYAVFVFENDSTDSTKSDIAKIEALGEGRVFASMNDFGRTQKANEFAGPRTIELAEYRNECRRFVERMFPDFEYTVVIDWDSWGGWTHEGAMTGFSYLATEEKAYGSASVSLIQYPCASTSAGSSEIKRSIEWVHYDCWALRLNSYWDDYSNGEGSWKHRWIPPVGSPPIRVCSAFGGFCIYKTEDFLRGEYSGQDCEHVCFHKTIEEHTGRGMYLNPSQRTFMHWIESEDNSRADSVVQG
jgi:hypothetical protein